MSQHSGQKPEAILSHIKEHVPSWQHLTVEKVDFTRLSGLSNACYKVQPIKSELQPLLYRKFECHEIDRNLEQVIFETLAKQGTGPPLIFQNQEYRIEGFMDARPITIWEMRNPIFYSSFADSICQLHYNKELIGRIS